MKTKIKQLSATAGYYIPAFFDMFIDTDKPIESFNLTSFDENERSVFFHEYIHFLQDFMTVCGCNNIYCINERFRLIALDYATQSPFYVPVEINDNKSNVRLNNLLNSLAWGGNKSFDSFVINGISVLPYTNDEIASAKINPFKYVQLDTDKGLLGFGKREIMESMAYILQKKCTKMTYLSPEYPYDSAEKLTKHICHTGFENNSENIVALCDVALMSSNPGFTFVSYLKKIESGELKVNRAEDVYDDFYSQKGICNGKVMIPLDHFELLSDAAKAALKSYINIAQIKVQLDAWVDLVMDTGLKVRKSDPYYFLNLARAGYLMTNAHFVSMLTTVGSPLMHNKNHQYGRQKSNPDYGDIFQYLTAVLSINNIFNGAFTCSLIHFCKQSKRKTNISVNRHCICSPWERCNDTQLCPVAMIIKHRKLAVNKPQIRPGLKLKSILKSMSILLS